MYHRAAYTTRLTWAWSLLSSVITENISLGTSFEKRRGQRVLRAPRRLAHERVSPKNRLGSQPGLQTARSKVKERGRPVPFQSVRIHQASCALHRGCRARGVAFPPRAGSAPEPWRSAWRWLRGLDWPRSEPRRTPPPDTEGVRIRAAART